MVELVYTPNLKFGLRVQVRVLLLALFLAFYPNWQRNAPQKRSSQSSNLWEATKCPCSATGRGNRFKTYTVEVRILSWAPNDGVAQQRRRRPVEPLHKKHRRCNSFRRHTYRPVRLRQLNRRPFKAKRVGAAPTRDTMALSSTGQDGWFSTNRTEFDSLQRHSMPRQPNGLRQLGSNEKIEGSNPSRGTIQSSAEI